MGRTTTQKFSKIRPAAYFRPTGFFLPSTSYVIIMRQIVRFLLHWSEDEYLHLSYLHSINIGEISKIGVWDNRFINLHIIGLRYANFFPS